MSAEEAPLPGFTMKSLSHSVQQPMAQTPVFLYLMQREGGILLNTYLCFLNTPDLLPNAGCTAGLLGFILRAGGALEQPSGDGD